MEVNDTCKSIVHSHNSLLMVLLLEFNQNAIMGNFLPLKNILVFNNWAKWVLIVFCFLRRAGGGGGGGRDVYCTNNYMVYKNQSKWNNM